MSTGTSLLLGAHGITFVGTPMILNYYADGDRRIHFPCNDYAFYATDDFQVDWDDGTATAFRYGSNVADLWHQYAYQGNYNVKVYGTVAQIVHESAYASYNAKLTAILDWGTLTTISSYGMFRDATSLASIPDGPMGVNIDPYMIEMFKNTAITSIPATLFSNFTDGSYFSANYMFNACSGITTYPATLFDGLAGELKYFIAETELSAIVANSFDNYLGVAGYLAGIFYHTPITSIPEDIFYYTGCTVFTDVFAYTDITSLPNRCFPDGTLELQGAFRVCTGLTSVASTIFDNLTSVGSVIHMFSHCTFTSIPATLFDPFGANLIYASYAFYQSGVTSIPNGFMQYNTRASLYAWYMFNFCANLTTIGATAFVGIRPVTTEEMFANCTSLTSASGLGSVDISLLENAQGMFNGVTLDTTDYSNILIGWEAQTELSGVVFDGGNSHYNAGAVSARGALTGSSTWTITDGGTP